MQSDLPQSGARVRLKVTLDLYPLGVFEAGLTGTVAAVFPEAEPGAVNVSVLLDRCFPALHDWNYCLEFNRPFPDGDRQGPVFSEHCETV